MHKGKKREDSSSQSRLRLTNSVIYSIINTSLYAVEIGI